MSLRSLPPKLIGARLNRGLSAAKSGNPVNPDTVIDTLILATRQGAERSICTDRWPKSEAIVLMFIRYQMTLGFIRTAK